MFESCLRLIVHSFSHRSVRRAATITTIVSLNQIYRSGPSNFVMSVLITAQPISFSDQRVSVGLYCIDTPNIWIGDISEAQNRWYIDIAINDDGLKLLSTNTVLKFNQSLSKSYIWSSEEPTNSCKCLT